MTSSVPARARPHILFFGSTWPAVLAFAAAKVPADIRDIRAPILLPAWWRWPLLALGAALVCAFVFGLVRFWQRRGERTLTPLERARRALQLADRYARESRSRAWADVVGETLRAALTARLGSEVLAQTTSELAAAPWAQAAAKSETQAAAARETFAVEAPRALELLRISDLARFAMASLDAEALAVHTAAAREIVEALFAPSVAAPQPTTPQLVSTRGSS